MARLDRHGFTLQARLDTGTALFRHSSIQARLHRHGSIQARLYRHGSTGIAGMALQAWLYRHGLTGAALQARTGRALQAWLCRHGSAGTARRAGVRKWNDCKRLDVTNHKVYKSLREPNAIIGKKDT